jgi:hypothetical protein
MGQSSNGNYVSDYTGNQIDEAVARSNEALQKAEANETDIAGKASQESMTNLANRVSALEQSGGTSSAVITNVNLLQQKIDELIDDLANSAFKTERTSKIGSLDWGSSTYTISISGSQRYTMSNIATSIEAGQPYENTITAVAGYELRSIIVNGVPQDITNNQQHTIYIASVQSNIVINITATIQGGPVTTYQITHELTDLKLTPDGGTAVQGGTFQGTLEIADGVVGKRLPDSITVAGIFNRPFTYNKDTGAIEIKNIQSDITITAEAVSVADLTIYTEADCVIQNEYVRWYSGIFKEYTGFRHSEYLPISPGQQVTVKTNYTSDEGGLAFFQDNNGTYCGDFHGGITTGVQYTEEVMNSGVTVTAPDNAAYFVFSYNAKNSANRVTVTVQD